ncbi:cytochrome P450 [Nostoc favosum]|uniref:Cytochrome P450 n=1 Tax=Nostoc favosum CHAB5714 TaxID=2780399 RepID=A0ABS8IE15_9NOSO|nr:cytochrome P450 [Nostoc favosum]MCC5602126.1 cytochrome P450 [Nostoc favosum CHAB5714]
MQVTSPSSTQLKKITAPGPRGLPIIGNLPIIGPYPYLTFTDLAKKYGDVFQIRIFSQPVVVLNRLETIREALLKQQGDFAGRPDFFTLRKAVKGRAIGGREYGLPWKRHREIAINALHMFVTSKTASIEQTVMQEATELVNILLSYQSQPFDPTMEVNLSVANVMVKILFGERCNRDDQDFIAFTKFAKDFPQNSGGALLADFMPETRIFFETFGQGLYRWRNALDKLEKFVVKKLKECRDSYNPKNLRGMVDALLKAVNELDESEKQTLGFTEKVIVEGTPQEMMGTGLQPIAPLICWAMLYMMANPDIQIKVHQELDTVVGRERQVCLTDRKKLPFTEACIHEILRHAPSFPLALPNATTTDTTINGHFIPKDTAVFINLYGLTRDERYWKEPEKFNPYRFLTDIGEVREDLLDKYYPFGLGKRRCLGEYLGRIEIFTFITNLMQKCTFERVPGEKLSFEGTPGAIFMPKDFKVIIKPRF